MMTNRTSLDSPDERRLSSDTVAALAALPGAEDGRRQDSVVPTGRSSSRNESPDNELRAATADAKAQVDGHRQLSAEGEEKSSTLVTSLQAAPLVTHDSVIARLLLDGRRPVFTGKTPRQQQQRKLKVVHERQLFSTASGGGIGEQPVSNSLMALTTTSVGRESSLFSSNATTCSNRQQQAVDMSAANVVTSFSKVISIRDLVQ